MAEIDDGELATLQRYKAVLDGLNGDPKAKKHLEAGLKAINPNIRTEADIAEEYAAPVREDLKSLSSKFDTYLTEQAEERKRLAEERADAALNTQIARLKQDGYTDDGLQKIVTLAKDRGIGDLEAAALLFDKQNPAPPVITNQFEPPAWDYQTQGSDSIEDTKLLFNDEDRWADQKAASVLNEIRQNKNGGY